MPDIDVEDFGVFLLAYARGYEHGLEFAADGGSDRAWGTGPASEAAPPPACGTTSVPSGSLPLRGSLPLGTRKPAAPPWLRDRPHAPGKVTPAVIRKELEHIAEVRLYLENEIPERRRKDEALHVHRGMILALEAVREEFEAFGMTKSAAIVGKLAADLGVSQLRKLT